MEEVEHRIHLGWTAVSKLSSNARNGLLGKRVLKKKGFTNPAETLDLDGIKSVLPHFKDVCYSNLPKANNKPFLQNPM